MSFGSHVNVPHPDSVFTRNALKSVTDMSALVAESVQDGRSLYVDSYHADLSIGGGVFTYDSSADKADHDGVNIIDPDVTFPASWANQTQVAAWYTAATGTGCWIRQRNTTTLTAAQCGAKGDWNGSSGTDDTLALKQGNAIIKTALRGALDLEDLKYLISAAITDETPAAWESYAIFGNGAELVVDSGATAFAFVIYIESSTNMNLDARGFIVRCNSLAGSGIYVDVRDASPSTLTAGGKCHIDIEVYDVLRPASVTSAAHAIGVIGAFERIDIRGIVDGVDRVTAASGNACKGVAVSDLVGVAHVDTAVSRVITPDGNDADGIAIFGRDNATPGDPDDFVFRLGTAIVKGAVITDCEGRHLKIQTSESIITGNKFIQEEVVMITGSESLNLQYANGIVADNEFIYRKTTGGASSIGSSHIPINVACLLTNEEMLTSITDNIIKTEIVLPRVVNFTRLNAASATTLEAVQLSINGNKVISILDLRGLDNVTRAFVEFAADDLVDHDKVILDVNHNSFSGALDCRLIGHTGFNGTDDLKSKLSLIACFNDNFGNVNNRVFRGISGSEVEKIEDIKFYGNRGLVCYMGAIDLDLDNLPGGTDFTYDIATSTIANTPTSYPASGTARIKTGNSSSGGTWLPAEMWLESGANYWARVSATWRTLI